MLQKSRRKLLPQTFHKKKIQNNQKSMSFWMPEGCGRVVGGGFSRNWLRFGARYGWKPVFGSVLAPRCESKKLFSRVASILMPHSEAESGYGINFDAVEKFFRRSLIFFDFS